MNFINLTSGIEWLPDIKPDGFVRIQSTWLEQKRWWPVIRDLDYTFLVAVAMGHDVVIYDTSAHKTESRAIFQGIPWITYVLNRVWLDTDIVPHVRGHNVQGYFRECFWDADPAAMRKLKYVAMLTKPQGVHITGKCKPSLRDGDYHWLGEHLKEKEHE